MISTIHELLESIDLLGAGDWFEPESNGKMAFLYLMAVGAALGITVIITKCCRCFRRRRRYNVPARDVRKGHRWSMTDLFSQPTYCSVSGELLIAGAWCDSCGICVDDSRMKLANKRLPCKGLSTAAGETHAHHWVEGNLPLGSLCSVCDEPCGAEPRLADFRCCWCARTVHETCRDDIDGSACDLGPHQQFIVPPNCVRLKQVGFKGRRHLVVAAVKEPTVTDWTPLIVIANRKSGNGDGEMILQAFRSLLNPAQVIDLADIPPECGLEWCHLLPHVSCRVLAAGGDGTVGWILSAIDNLKLKPTPQVGILPLGTGNDLARVLGWGEGYTGDVDVRHILDQLETAVTSKLDRWKVEITSAKHFGIPLPRKELVMNNYASIGVDALVTLNFHKHRESRPALFGSRIINKFWYFTYGTKDVLERECKHLHKKIKLEMDDKPVELPEIEGVVVLNIPSWGGGCRPWEIGGTGRPDVPTARTDDGLLEVFALYSSFHIAQLQVGLAEPLRLGQASKVKITLSKGKAPMQVDGEPWEQTPATILIDLHNQVTMLAAPPS